MSVLDGVIRTSITADWRSAGIADGTVLQVRMAGRTFKARFLVPAHYAQIVADPTARQALDVDVVCTLEQGPALVVIILGGGLPGSFGVRPGISVAVEKP